MAAGPPGRPRPNIDEGLRAYMLGVYNYMTIGLAVTGLVALGTFMLAESAVRRRQAGGAVALRPDALHDAAALGRDAGAAGLRLLPRRARQHACRPPTARNLFIAFSAVMGVSMSSILLVFTGASVARVFFITAAAFGGLSLYGYMTKRDLSAFGSFLVMGVWGLVIAGLVNLFLQSSGLQFALSILVGSDLLRPDRLGHAEHQGHVLRGRRL